MKKCILAIVFGFTMTISCFAQETEDFSHHEVYASVGLLNDNQLFSMVGDVLGAVLTFGQAVKPDKYWILTPSVGYRYWFNKKIGIGVHFAFDKNSVKAIHAHDLSTTSDDEWRVHNRYFYTLAAEVNWKYLDRPICQLYGNAGLGVTLVQFSDNKNPNPDAHLKQFPFFNMNVMPFGVRVGKMVGGFAEIGWGYKGFFNVGVSVKL